MELCETLMRVPNKDIYNFFFYATMCHVCKRFGNGVRLKKCGGCKMIFYCGRQHQTQHWAQHKFLCRAIRDVLQKYPMEHCNVTPEYWCNVKRNFKLLVTLKLERELDWYERQMFEYPRECAICYERQSLEDCQKCALSFCKNRKDCSIAHKDICDTLELYLRLNLSVMREESDIHLDMDYLEHVSDMCTFQDMEDFINIYRSTDNKIFTEMPYDIWTARHSDYLTRPLTLFHAMRLLNYVPKRKDLVIHVIGANYFEETTLRPWTVLLQLIGTLMSVMIVMIGPELKSISSFICSDLSEKKCLFQFHNVLYKEYVRGSFVKPDLVVGFNVGINEYELASSLDTWTSSIQVLAKRVDCPFVLTSYTREELELDVNRINTILEKKVDYLYSGKNPFASLTPHRTLGPERIFYQNYYIVIYKSLCS